MNEEKRKRGLGTKRTIPSARFTHFSLPSHSFIHLHLHFLSHGRVNWEAVNAGTNGGISSLSPLSLSWTVGNRELEEMEGRYR